MARKKPEEPEMEQGVLDPEFKPVENARVHKAAKRYYDAIKERMALTEEEKEAHDTLLNTMMEEGIEHYVYQGLEAHVNTSKKCKVKVQSDKVEKGGEEE